MFRMEIQNKVSVLPAFHSIVAGCFILSGHMIRNIPNAYSVKVEASSGLDMTCVNKFGSVFPFCLIDGTDVDGIADLGPAAVFACPVLCVAIMVYLKGQLGDISEKRKMFVQPIGRRNQISVLPNFHSCMIMVGVFCAHATSHLRQTYGVLSSAAENAAGNEYVTKFGSTFPFCLPGGHSETRFKLLPAVVLGLITLSLIALAAQNLVHSYSSIEQKGQNSVLPNFRSLLLGCAIFSVYLAHHAQNASGFLDTASVSVIGSIAAAVVVQVAVQQSNNISSSGKKSVLPNAYSSFMICCVFCAHSVHNCMCVYDKLGASGGYGISAFPSEALVKMVPVAGFLVFFVVVMALQQQSASTSKIRQASVLPNVFSVMLICCLLCAHSVHNRPQRSNMSSLSISVTPILGASNEIIPFGHKDYGLEDIASNILEGIPATILEKSLQRGAKATTTSTYTYPADHSDVISGASPKAIFASVLFAFIGMTLKMGTKSTDKKGKTSVLPNLHSVLLICCILIGHAVHNWTFTFTEHNSNVSIDTGVNEVGSWHGHGSVLPDTPEDLDSLLEVSPEILDQPSDMLTLR